MALSTRFTTWMALMAAAATAGCGAMAAEVPVGKFRNYAHGIAGDVFALDEKTLFIKGFRYDGAGPDAFFWVGTEGRPSTKGTILPHPFEGKFYDYEDNAAPILKGRYDGVDIRLTLPDQLKVTDLKWLSVWCRAFKVNFGDVMFPENLQLKEAAEPNSTSEKAVTPPELPPPVVVSNDLDDTQQHHDEDEDVHPEAEAEAEPKAEPDTAHPENGSLRTAPLSHFLFALGAVVVLRFAL